MLSKAHIIHKIHNAYSLLEDLDLIERCINPSLLKVNKNFNRVALDSSKSYVEIYLAGLQEQYFNFILKDYSFFQFNFLENDKAPHNDKPYARYAFYPNPFNRGDEGLEDISKLYKNGDISFEEYSQAISEYDPQIHKPLVRYDLSFLQYKRLLHPTAHFHFGTAEDTRIATDKIFSPYLFVMFIIKTYYSDSWEILSDTTNDFDLDKKMIAERKSSASINEYGDKYFCTLQERLVYLT